MKRTLKIVALAILILVIGLWLFFRSERKIGTVKGTATLSWEKGEDANVASYKIYYGTAKRNSDCPPGGYEKNQEVGDVSEFTLDDLESGTTYYFSVSALNAAKKESCFSAEMKKEIPSAMMLNFSALWQ